MDYSHAPLPEVFQHFLKTNPFLFAGSNVLLQKPVGSGRGSFAPTKTLPACTFAYGSKMTHLQNCSSGQGSYLTSIFYFS